MPRLPAVKSVELEEDYYHVRFRDPGEFDRIRTPDWAEDVAQDVSDGSRVRMGQRADSDDWVVQSVLIRKEAGESKAEEQATKIIEKIEE